MSSAFKSDVSDAGPEQVVILSKVGMPVSSCEEDNLGSVLGIPAESGLGILLDLLNILDRQAFILFKILVFI